jgi:hypothetical protein
MPASIQKFHESRKMDPNTERLIECPYCAQAYLLTWDDKEWNSVKDWIGMAERAVRKSHPRHGDVELPVSLKVPLRR